MSHHALRPLATSLGCSFASRCSMTKTHCAVALWLKSSCAKQRPQKGTSRAGFGRVRMNSYTFSRRKIIDASASSGRPV